MTRQPMAAEGFYSAVFGWIAETADPGDTAYTVFGLADVQVGGTIETAPHLPGEVPDTWSGYFNVRDCAATENLAEEPGGQVILPSTDTPMGRFAVVADPQGAVFQIMQFTGTQEPEATEAEESTS